MGKSTKQNAHVSVRPSQARNSLRVCCGSVVRLVVAGLCICFLAFAADSAAQPPIIDLQHPRLTIGTAMGSAANSLAGVAGVVRLPDGRIAIAEVMNARVGLFNASGEPIGVIARQGSGPGEVRQPAWVGTCGREEFAVFDANQNLLLHFNARGEWLRSTRLPEQTLFNEVIRCWSDGSLLMLFRQPTGPAGPPGRIFDVPAHLSLVKAGGAIDTLASAGATSYYISRNMNGFSQVPLRRAVLVAAGSTRTYVADNVSGRIEVRDSAGNFVRSWRPLFDEIPARARDWDIALKRYVATVPLRRTQDLFRQVLSEVEPPEAFPAIAAIAADALDRIWIQGYIGYGSDTATWFVYDERGRAVATVRMPYRLRIIEITANELLGIEMDADGVERVVRYDLPPRIPLS